MATRNNARHLGRQDVAWSDATGGGPLPSRFNPNPIIANGSTTAMDVSGYDRQYIELNETAGGTATVQFQGSYDSVNWYTIGQARVDAQATTTRSVTAASVTASSKTVWNLIDLYPLIRLTTSALAGNASIVASFYGVPV